MTGEIRPGLSERPSDTYFQSDQPTVGLDIECLSTLAQAKALGNSCSFSFQAPVSAQQMLRMLRRRAARPFHSIRPSCQGHLLQQGQLPHHLKKHRWRDGFVQLDVDRAWLQLAVGSWLDDQGRSVSSVGDSTTFKEQNSSQFYGTTTMSNSTSTSSFTFTVPPAMLTGVIPKARCLSLAEPR
jgi:hypothetical protein